VNTRASSPRSAKPIAYLQSRSRARDQDIFFEDVLERFVCRFDECEKCEDWRIIFKSEADAEAFLEDLRNFGFLSSKAITYFSLFETFDAELINGMLADELESWSIPKSDAQPSNPVEPTHRTRGGAVEHA
jgi:hypothetical protein